METKDFLNIGLWLSAGLMWTYLIVNLIGWMIEKARLLNNLPDKLNTHVNRIHELENDLDKLRDDFYFIESNKHAIKSLIDKFEPQSKARK